MKNFKAIGALKTDKQAGFTIIELVVVILLLGILTATALPRFLDISTEAHDAAVDAAEGGLRTGGALFRAHWFAENQTTGVVGGTDWDSQRAHPTTGFPVGTSTGVSGNTIDLHSECEAVFEGILQSGVTLVEDAFTALSLGSDSTTHVMTDANMVTANAAGTYDWVAVFTGANACSFFYVADAARLTAAGAPRLTYNAASPTLTWTRFN